MASSSYDGESSNSQNRFEYQVFLSFRGADVRKGFIDHLFRRLKDEGVRVFLDNNELEHGKKITFLFEAIERSQIFLVTFSPGYSDSKWCLDELVKIMERKDSLIGQHVLPVFYNVEPTDVRHQTGPYEKSFIALEDQFEDDMGRVMEYRTALRQVTELRGLSLKDTNGYEGQLVENVIVEVKKRLCTRRLFVKQNIVGRDSIVRDLSMWLQNGSNDAQVGMIYGPGGIGKSTVSQIVYNDNLDKFSGSCFLADFQREATQGRGLTYLLEQIISDISKKPSAKIYNVPSGLTQVRDVVSCRKILLVLDDVWELTQLEAMFDDPGFFHPGSKIIITTRNQEIRKACNSKKEFSISELSSDESDKLFSLHAFQSDQPPQEFMTLSRRFIDYCQGLPLALCILASSLRSETKDIWDCMLNKLSEGPDDKVQSILKLSFDSIKDEVAKDLFLHVAHFFVGMRKEDAYTILEGLELHPKLGGLRLVNRCLVTIDANDKLMMHQLIQEMAREVVRQEARYEPGHRSRLSNFEDSYKVLKRNKGTGKVRCLRLDFRASVRVRLTPSPRTTTLGDPPVEFVVVRTDAFTKMENLEMLQLYHAQLTGDYSDFPKEIRWLFWERCPLQSIPSDLELDELVVLDMEKSNLVHVWESTKALEALKVINLSHSTDLVSTPNFSGCLALERVVLEGCTKLVEIHESITQLSKLTYLNVIGCKSLKRIPHSTAASVYAYGCTELVEIGDNIKLESRTNMVACRAEYMGYSGLESFVTSEGNGPFGCYKGVYQCGLYSVFLVGDHIGKWFTTIARGPKLNYIVPSLPDRQIRAFNICCVYECNDIIAKGIIEVHNQSSSCKWLYVPKLYPLGMEVTRRPSYTWMTHWPIITQHRELNAGDMLEICLHGFSYDTPKKYGIHILYEEEAKEEGADHVQSCNALSNNREGPSKGSVAAWYETFCNVDLSTYEHEPGIYYYRDLFIHLINDHRILNSKTAQSLITFQIAVRRLLSTLPRTNAHNFRSIPVFTNPAPPQLINLLRQIPTGNDQLEMFLQLPKDDGS